MIITVFRSRLREDFDRRIYESHAAKMYETVSEMPGFRSIKSFTADDGERVSIVEFASMPDQMNWARNDAHREAQQAGRDTYYAEYDIAVCEEIRRSSWRTPASGTVGSRE